jgi:hypothetical protein
VVRTSFSFLQQQQEKSICLLFQQYFKHKMPVDIEFKNVLSYPIELVVTQNGQPMQVLANLAPK